MNDIANDLNAYSTSSRVLAIAMRNIIEYFFTFNNKLDKLQDAEQQLISNHKEDAEAAQKIRAFFRFVNKGAHSDPKNDYADANSCEPEKWLKYFEEIFKQTASKAHYDKYRKNCNSTN